MNLAIFEDIDCLADIYALESYHYSIIKDNMRVRHMEAVNEYPEIITEAFSDIVSKMGGFFKKMGSAFKNFFGKTAMAISACFSDIETFTKKYKDQLDKITDVNFDITGYKFTLDKKPDVSEFERIVSSYNSELSDISKYKNIDQIKKLQNDYLTKENLAKIRKDILGGVESSDDDNFAEVAKKTYRNGETSDSTITVDTAMFRSTVQNAEALSKGKKEADQLYQKMTYLINKTETFFSRSIPSAYNKGEASKRAHKIDIDYKDNGSFKQSDAVYVSAGSSDKLNAFVRFKYNQVHAISGYINIAVREYLNAYKAQVKQARAIIRGALNDKPEETKDGEDTNKDKEGDDE